jgi:hypothetical protein
MIVGVSAKVVPTLNGVDCKRLTKLWGPFLLINVGCLLRVVGQTLTDFTPSAFPWAGASGVLEVGGLAVWGGHLTLIMAGKVRVRQMAAKDVPPPLKDREIGPTDTIAAVLGEEPRLLDVMVRCGLTLLGNEYLRLTFARVVTLRQACLRMGVDEARTVAELNCARARFRSMELPILAERSLGTCEPEAKQEFSNQWT